MLNTYIHNLAKRLMCGGIVSDKLSTKLLLNVPVKEFWKLVNRPAIRSYEVMELYGLFYAPPSAV